MADETTLNLSVIQTYDQLCTHILDKSCSTHMYSFQHKTGSWIKSKIGGVFFLYKRSKMPFTSFMILNHKSPHMNHIEFITSSLRIQLHAPFLLYKTGKGGIFSIWFYSSADCIRITESIGKTVFDLGGLGLCVAPTTDKPKESKSSTPSHKLESKAVSDGLNHLMNIIRSSTESNGMRAQRTAAVERTGINGVTDSTGQSTERSNKPTQTPSTGSNEAPNLLHLLHKAELDFNSESLRKSNPSSGKSLTNELLRLRTACKIASSDCPECGTASKPVQLALPLTKPTDRAVIPTRSSDHISVAELEQQLLCNPYFGEDEATDGSSNGDQRALNEPGHKSSDVRFIESASATVPVPCLLSDLDAGYADDVDEAFEEEVQDVPASERHQQYRTISSAPGGGGINNTTIGIQRKQRRHIRNWENTSGSLEKQSHTCHMLSEMPDCTKSHGRDEVESNDNQCEVLLTPDMLTCSPSTLVTTLQNTHLSPSVSTRKSELSMNGVINSSSCSVFTEGLTKEQLREALIHLLYNDGDFLHQIHQAYMLSLERRLMRS